MALTKEQKEARGARRMEILARITSSGEVTDPSKASALAAEIETFEWAEGDETAGGLRRAVVGPMLSQGYVKISDIVAKATASLAAIHDFK
ncbi:MAG: hypothetical protein ABIY37_01500 [Devosia sp.]